MKQKPTRSACLMVWSSVRYGNQQCVDMDLANYEDPQHVKNLVKGSCEEMKVETCVLASLDLAQF